MIIAKDRDTIMGHSGGVVDEIGLSRLEQMHFARALLQGNSSLSV